MCEGDVVEGLEGVIWGALAAGLGEVLDVGVLYEDGDDGEEGVLVERAEGAGDGLWKVEVAVEKDLLVRAVRTKGMDCTPIDDGRHNMDGDAPTATRERRMTIFWV